MFTSSAAAVPPAAAASKVSAAAVRAEQPDSFGRVRRAGAAASCHRHMRCCLQGLVGCKLTLALDGDTFV